jgi:hypothetical protein
MLDVYGFCSLFGICISFFDFDSTTKKLVTYPSEPSKYRMKINDSIPANCLNFSYALITSIDFAHDGIVLCGCIDVPGDSLLAHRTKMKRSSKIENL